jgi:hypothetical protein
MEPNHYCGCALLLGYFVNINMFAFIALLAGAVHGPSHGGHATLLDWGIIIGGGLIIWNGGKLLSK